MASKLGKYELIRTLGKGAYSKVKLARNVDTGDFVAIKIHKTDTPEFSSEIRQIVTNEVRTIMKLQHDNIVQVKDYMDDEVVEKPNGSSYNVSCVVVQEICDGGELFYYVLNSGYFSPQMARYLFKQIVNGLIFMQA
jgi:serine/threonine protein kinase